ncbi:MAG: dTMP kinase, partial [Patescibacteria group bacterium]
MKPRLIALEGIDYSGKSTLAPALTGELLNRRINAICTAEPSEGPFGQKIRAVLRGEAEGPGTERAFQAWFVRDRLWHIKNLLYPAHASGIWAVLDRYWLSTIAYGMLVSTAEDFIELHREIIGRRMMYPDITIVLDLPMEEALLRAKARGAKPEYFEKRELLEKVRKADAVHSAWEAAELHVSTRADGADEPDAEAVAAVL